MGPPGAGPRASRELMAVELPFYVRDSGEASTKHKVLALLGGQQALDKSVFSNAGQKNNDAASPPAAAAGSGNAVKLSLWTQPECRRSTTVMESTPIPRLAVALKIRRKRKSQEITKAELIGFAEDCHGFTSLCDFAYRPGVLNDAWDPTKIGLLSAVEDEIPEAIQSVRRSRVQTRLEALEARNRMYIPAPFFATSQPPQSLDFSDGKTSGATGGAGAGEGAHSIPLVDIDAADAVVPRKQVGGAALTPRRSEHIRAKVRAAMNRKPVWTRETLANYIGCSHDLLARSAWADTYQATIGGAFSGNVYLSRDFDPRQSRHSAQYQPLRFRVPKDIVARLQTQRKRLGLTNMDWLGSRVKTLSTVLIGDVPDEDFLQLARARVASHYRPRLGWFTEETRQLLSRQLNKTMSKLVNALESATDTKPLAPGKAESLLRFGRGAAVPSPVWAGETKPGADHLDAGQTSAVAQNMGQSHLPAVAVEVFHDQGAPPLPPPMDEGARVRFNLEHRGNIDYGTLPPTRPSVAKPGGSSSSGGGDGVRRKPAMNVHHGKSVRRAPAADSSLAYAILGDDDDDDDDDDVFDGEDEDLFNDDVGDDSDF